MFSLIQANIQEQQAKKEELRELLIKKKIDVACLRETCLDDKSPGKINIPHYEIITDNKDEVYGGSVIILRTELDTEKLKVNLAYPYSQLVAAHIKKAGLVIASVFVREREISSL